MPWDVAPLVGRETELARLADVLDGLSGPGHGPAVVDVTGAAGIGIARLLRSDYSDPVNCGNPIETTILEFAERIKARTKSPSEIVFRPLPVDDPKVRQPDIGRASKLLGWEPKVALEDCLRQTIAYFKPVLGLE